MSRPPRRGWRATAAACARPPDRCAARRIAGCALLDAEIAGQRPVVGTAAGIGLDVERTVSPARCGRGRARRGLGEASAGAIVSASASSPWRRPGGNRAVRQGRALGARRRRCSLGSAHAAARRIVRHAAQTAALASSRSGRWWIRCSGDLARIHRPAVPAPSRSPIERALHGLALGIRRRLLARTGRASDAGSAGAGFVSIDGCCGGCEPGSCPRESLPGSWSGGACLSSPRRLRSDRRRAVPAGSSANDRRLASAGGGSRASRLPRGAIGAASASPLPAAARRRTRRDLTRSGGAGTRLPRL